MSGSSTVQTPEKGGPSQVEVIIGDTKPSPFNAICLAAANTVDNSSRHQGTAFIVKAKSGQLAAITAGHVIKDLSQKVDCVAHPERLQLFPGTYGFVPPNKINSNTPMVQAAKCIVHPKCDPASNDFNVAHYDIGIVLFPLNQKINGAPMAWAPSDGVLPKSPSAPLYSVTGHRDAGNNLEESCQMRMIKVENYSRPYPHLFSYTSGSTSFGAGFSGGPVINAWSASPGDIKTATAYGHHVKKWSPNMAAPDEPKGGPATVWFAAVKYTGEIADWLRSQGL